MDEVTKINERGRQLGISWEIQFGVGMSLRRVKKLYMKQIIYLIYINIFMENMYEEGKE